MGGNGSYFVYFDGAGLHDFFAPSGNQGRPGNPNSGQDRDVGLPLVLGTLFWHAGQVLRMLEHITSWHDFLRWSAVLV